MNLLAFGKTKRAAVASFCAAVMVGCSSLGVSQGDERLGRDFMETIGVHLVIEASVTEHFPEVPGIDTAWGYDGLEVKITEVVFSGPKSETLPQPSVVGGDVLLASVVTDVQPVIGDSYTFYLFFTSLPWDWSVGLALDSEGDPMNGFDTQATLASLDRVLFDGEDAADRVAATSEYALEIAEWLGAGALGVPTGPRANELTTQSQGEG